MSNIQNINTQTLRSYMSSFTNEKAKFASFAYNTFKNSYLATCSNCEVNSMYNKLNEKYQRIEKYYNSITTYISEYISNVEGIENSLTNNGGSITESNIRSSINGLPELKDYQNNLHHLVVPNANVVKGFVAGATISSKLFNNSTYGNVNQSSEYENYTYQSGLNNNNYMDLRFNNINKKEKGLGTIYSTKRGNLTNKFQKVEEYNMFEIEAANKEYQTLLNSKIEELDTQLETYKPVLDEQKELLSIREQEYNALSSLGEEAAVSIEGEESAGQLRLKELEEEISKIKADVSILEQAIEKLEQEKELAPFILLTGFDSYQTYRVTTSNYSEEDWKEIFDNSKYTDSTNTPRISYSKCVEVYGSDAPSPLEFRRAAKKLYGDLNQLENGTRVLDEQGYENYEVLDLVLELEEINPEISKLYNYIYETQGLEEANKYLDAMEESINQLVGEKRASEFLATLNEDSDINDVEDYLKTTIKGLGDGAESFEAGISEWFDSHDITTPAEYESMYILLALAKEEDKKTAGLIEKVEFESGEEVYISSSSIIDYTKDYGAFLDKDYKYSQAIGNILPSIAINTIVPGAGIVSLGVSAGGQAYHGALVEGYGNKEAITYGVLCGVTAATLEKVLGKIPGLGNISEGEGLLSKMLGEGIEEGLEQIIQSGVWDQLVLGKGFNLDEVAEETLESFIDGMIISALLNGPGSTINVIKNGTNYEINYDQIQEIVKKMNEGTTSTEALNQSLVASSRKSSIAYYNPQSTEWNTIRVDQADSLFGYFDKYNGGYGVAQEDIENSYFYKNKYNGQEYNEKEMNYLRSRTYVSPSDFNKIGSKEYGRLKNKLMTEYGFCATDASQILSGVDKIGACSYAATANEIVIQFQNNLDYFEHTFGFKLIEQQSDGSLKLNSSELLLDIYIFANSTENGGNLFTKNPCTGKMEICNFDHQNTDLSYRYTLNSNDQQYLASYMSKNDTLLDNYLKSKDPNLAWENHQIYKGYDNDYSNVNIEDLKATSIYYLNSNYELHLGIYTGSGQNPIRMINMDTGQVDVTTNNWNEGSGHGVYVTGMNDEGYIVSSWGKKYLIPFEDLQKGMFTLDVDRITYQNGGIK